MHANFVMVVVAAHCLVAAVVWITCKIAVSSAIVEFVRFVANQRNTLKCAFRVETANALSKNAGISDTLID